MCVLYFEKQVVKFQNTERREETKKNRLLNKSLKKNKLKKGKKITKGIQDLSTNRKHIYIDKLLEAVKF